MAMLKHSKETIVNILKEHPEGLTIGRIAKLSKMSRITATKYIQELIGEGRLRERRIGAARLLFLKERFLESVREERIIKEIGRKFR